MNTKELWSGIKDKLKHKLGSVLYNAYIETLDPVSFDQNKLILVANTEFIQNYVIKRHLADIEDASFQFLNKNIEIEIINKNELDEIAKTLINKKSKEEDDSEQYELNLDPDYTFENFVVGKSNDFANAACHSVAENPSNSFNPLFLYGGVGLGKTHLMQAIAHRVLEKFKDKRVMYVTSEKFTNELINILRTSNNENYKTKFRKKYRNADILIIDDIQFIAGKDSVQEEFFHTFNDLYAANKQIIISSDRPPKEIEMLEKRLSSRFEQGLKVDIKSPDFETRMAILMNKAESIEFKVPYDVIEYIATNVSSNIRELEGALTRLHAFSTLTNQKEINLEMAQNALKDTITSYQNKVIDVDRIKEKVAEEYGITVSEINAKKRNKSLVVPRQVAMYLARELTDLSFPRIGDEFGGRDHTTVLYAYNKIEEMIKNEEDVRIKIEKITAQIKG